MCLNCCPPEEGVRKRGEALIRVFRGRRMMEQEEGGWRRREKKTQQEAERHVSQRGKNEVE